MENSLMTSPLWMTNHFVGGKSCPNITFCD